MNIVPFKLRQTTLPAAPADYDVQYQIVHGYRRAFVHVGEGTPLLMIHGIGDSSDTWRQVIPELSRDHRIVAPDLLGHGRSDKPRADYSVAAYANAMRDLLSVLDIERVTVVGHSLGGGVAMQFAYQYPERCERLVLVSTGGVSHEVHPALRWAATPVADLFLPLLRLTPVRLAGMASVRVMEVLRTDLGRDAEHLLRMFESLPDATARRAFVRTIRAVVDWRGQAITMLDRCYLTRGMPTLLMWGAHDAVIPMHHGQIAHRAMPGSRLETFPEAGHFPHQADPARFVSLMREFIATTTPASFTSEDWRALLRRGRPSTLPAPEPTGPLALEAPLVAS